MIWSFIDQIVQQGVTDFFLAPGSRSSPLALAISRHPKIKLHRHFDERGLAFYAYGHALATQKPTAIVVTSGTAVGNLLPAIMEAHHTSTPLLILTADRPPELRYMCANQTTDQIKIFQNFVRWQFDLDLTMQPTAIRSHAAQAVFHTATGPVHINCPCRDPLYQVPLECIQGKPIPIQRPNQASLPPQQLPTKGIILLGRCPETSAVTTLAEKLGWPIFADVLSSLRSHPNQIQHFDWILKNAPRPECVLHFGDRLTSKRVMEWLSASRLEHYYHISAQNHWNDSYTLLTSRIQALPSAVSFHTTPDPTWLKIWKSLDQINFPEETTFTETSAFKSLNSLPLENWSIFLANSMPIREADWFLFAKAKQFFANRGLSGIDGNIATIAGLAHHGPILGIVGDMTALHDLNSLALLKSLPVILLISNNDGGGIFSHLPYAVDPQFEILWGFSHQYTFSHAAKLFHLPYTHVSTAAELTKALTSALETKQCHLIEMTTDRQINATFHKKLRSLNT